MHWDLEPPGLPADNVLQQARSMVRDCALLSAAAEISCVVALLRKSVHGLQCKPARCYEAGRVGCTLYVYTVQLSNKDQARYHAPHILVQGKAVGV